MLSYKPGDLIVSSTPFAYVVDPLNGAGRVCDYCFKRCESLKPCARCRVAHYCNKLCEASALSEHLPECCYFEEVFPDIPDVTVRLLTRITHKLQKERMKDCKEMVQGHMRTLEEMESHSNDIMNDAVMLPKFHASWATVKYILGEENVPPLLDGLEIFGKMVINRFCITDSDLKPVGQGLYIGASIFDHSCDPDAAYVFEGTRLTVRATRSLSVNSVREIYICYVDKLLLKEDRIAALQRQYYFTCNCIFCKEDARDPLTEKWSGLTECVRNLQLELDKADSKADVERIASRCREILECQCKELPTNDIAKVETLLLGFQCGTRMAAHAEAIGFALQAMEIMRSCYGMYSAIYGLHLVNIGKLYNDSGDNASAESFLQMASSSMSISHGTTHATYRELQQLRKLNRRGIPGGCK
ncbi:histone-lysine N-methyltransferase SMYD3-like [Dermacentor variabilis]|uniref:histone-lysine N-methyltransferase SMYD3-like n=1 Tax=Dermacentor variabilis TaxID=34621 RepID=UPI003F5BB1D1